MPFFRFRLLAPESSFEMPLGVSLWLEAALLVAGLASSAFDSMVELLFLGSVSGPSVFPSVVRLRFCIVNTFLRPFVGAAAGAGSPWLSMSAST